MRMDGRNGSILWRARECLQPLNFNSEEEAQEENFNCFRMFYFIYVFISAIQVVILIKALV